MAYLNILLLVFILVCAVSVSFAKSLLSSVIIFMAQSLAMSLIWILLESPDLGVTEAAVGAGVTSILMFVALKKLHAVKDDKNEDKE